MSCRWIYPIYCWQKGRLRHDYQIFFITIVSKNSTWLFFRCVNFNLIILQIINHARFQFNNILNYTKTSLFLLDVFFQTMQGTLLNSVTYIRYCFDINLSFCDTVCGWGWQFALASSYLLWIALHLFWMCVNDDIHNSYVLTVQSLAELYDVRIIRILMTTIIVPYDVYIESHMLITFFQ